MQIKCLSNGSYSLKNCQNPFDKAIQPPPPPFRQNSGSTPKSLRGAFLTQRGEAKVWRNHANSIFSWHTHLMHSYKFWALIVYIRTRSFEYLQPWFSKGKAKKKRVWKSFELWLCQFNNRKWIVCPHVWIERRLWLMKPSAKWAFNRLWDSQNYSQIF